MVNSVSVNNQNNSQHNTTPYYNQNTAQASAKNTPNYTSAPTSNTTNGVVINCPVLDISKLSPEEREKYLAGLQSNQPQINNYPAYPPGYYINNYGNNNNTVKKRVVVLTDEYIQNLDQMLQSENQEYREYAASEVLKRLEEDKTRYNDKALNALINKMVMDPFDHKVRGRGLVALETGLASGDENTDSVLQWILQDPNILDRDKGSIARIQVQRSANTTLVNAPITSGGTATA